MASNIKFDKPYDQGVEAAFFDLDKTIIAKHSMMAFRVHARKEGMLKRRTVLRFILSHIVYLHLGASEEKIQRIRESVLKLICGWPEARTREFVKEAIEEVITPIIYREALELIREHHAAGRLVVIISASPVEIVEPLAAHLGADVAIGSRVKIDRDGRYTDQMEFFAQGDAKAHAIEEMAFAQDINLERSFAYSDSVTDQPMLESVGHPVVINPDRALLRLAGERSWDVRRFSHPIPMMKRPAVQKVANRQSLLVVALGAAALAGFLTLRRTRRS